MTTNGRLIELINQHSQLSYAKIGLLAGGISRQRVHQVASQAGLKRDKKPYYHRTDITVERVVNLYHQDMLLGEIKRELHCNSRSVMIRLRAGGISESECRSQAMKLHWRRLSKPKNDDR